MNDYAKQADDFLTKHDLRFRSTFKGDRCPPWCDGKCAHGDRYRVTISRKGDGRLSFDFWNSLNDLQNRATTVAPYDALACLSSDADTPDTFEEFCGECGYDPDSRKAHNTFKRCDRFAQRLRAFFTDDELGALAEIC